MSAQIKVGTYRFKSEAEERVRFGEGLLPGTEEWDHFQIRRKADFNRWRQHIVAPVGADPVQIGPVILLCRRVARWLRLARSR